MCSGSRAEPQIQITFVFSVFLVAKCIPLYTFYMFCTAKANYSLATNNSWKTGLTYFTRSV
jgi:hypothetical protein